MHRSVYLTILLAGMASPLSAQDAPSPAAVAWTHADAGLQWGPCPDFLPEGCAITVLQGDPAAANADIFFKVPAGSSIVSHRHTSAERMVLVSGELEVTYDGHEPAVLRPGSYAYGPAGMPHSAQCAPGDDCVLFIAFESPVDAFATAGDAMPDGSE